MSSLDLVIDLTNIAIANKAVLVKYSEQLAIMEPMAKTNLIAIHDSQVEGPVIASIAFLAMVDVASFQTFANYINGIALEMLDEVVSGKRDVGDKRQVICTAASLKAYIKIMQDESREVAACSEFSIDCVLMYVSTLLCFLHLYRCCHAANEVLDFYDDTYVKNWFSICGIPLIQPFNAAQVSYH